MKYCVVKFCDNHKGTLDKNIQMFRVPVDEETKKKWNQAIETANGEKFCGNGNICQLHFENDHFKNTNSQRLLLKKESIPSLFPSNPSIDVIEVNDEFLPEIQDLPCKSCDELKFLVFKTQSDFDMFKITNEIKMSKEAELKTKNTSLIKALKSKISQLESENKKIHKKYSALVKSQQNLPNSLEKNTNDILINCLRNGVKVRSKYPPEVREFCLGLQFRSTAGYEFVRKTFKNNLPNLSTLRAWYSESDMNAEPGIHSKCLEILSQKSAQMKKNGKQLVSTLMFDEIYIRKHVQYCHSSKKILGLASYGNRSADPELAKQVIVFMLSGINSRFQLPIAYHFISSLTQDDRRKLLIEVINALHKAGVTIANLTFDGHPSNIPMCNSLGANLNVFSESFQPYIVMNETKIFILLDPCHMQKLARNTLGKKEVIIDGEGNKIKWVYFEKLVHFSRDKGLALCHKMNNKHLQWKRKIMKVDLAVQTLSQSVATCLQFLMENGFKEFTGAAATIKYVSIFNNLFDVFNTKPNSENENQLKVPICANSKEDIFCLFNASIDYLKGLRIVEANGRDVLLCRSRLRTAFIGYIINMKSLMAMFEDYIENERLMESIPTHSLLQDHLELFFLYDSFTKWIQ